MKIVAFTIFSVLFVSANSNDAESTDWSTLKDAEGPEWYTLKGMFHDTKTILKYNKCLETSTYESYVTYNFGV
ncbi:hypothetical protein PoB_000581500 [Plakobranchus ocellatus]|uniref:Uncharacterized protein n=1 Tax=Plakobranchus ocellatus TaxID=259542 RepID=A0AAV3Y858_9GAST|nr:hypothetical protein PoB_000581500 [Plakobranchus ocellatus]